MRSIKVPDKVLKLVNSKWHEEFVKFVSTGDASQEFLDHLDSDGNTQKAVDIIMDVQVVALHKFADDLKLERTQSRVKKENTLSKGIVNYIKFIINKRFGGKENGRKDR